MADSLDKIKRDIEKMKQQRIEAGYHGEEYEAHKATKPRPSLPLAFRCYYELTPLYEFMVEYAERVSKAGEPIPFDLSILDHYKRYLEVIHYAGVFKKKRNGDYDYDASTLTSDFISIYMATIALDDLVTYKRPYLEALGSLMTSLTFKYEQFPRSITSRRIYNGKHVEALVDRYSERIKAYEAESKRIAEKNVKQRGETRNVRD
ncbi:hypothetical protein JOD03_002557 [Chryseomicrobium aureum]|uniref:hypothetical protein n=1 Tax=Chryseomicrobium aureum TaxID=1441723 RepID=UPI001959CE2B|nr:hypothetical protein [Chryseomicrobium aureum]MBM7707610.1 hypothetical protein [Chryseomicrobium aureum]